MLTQQHKNSPYTTNQSWYTPPKHKNPSNIQTNPSINVISFPSHQYSSIQLSQSYNASPSFLSPNKQITSFLMTPNYSHNQSFNQSNQQSSQIKPSSASQLISDFRLKTQSLIETSKFYDHTQDKNNYINHQQIKSNYQKTTISKSQIQSLIKLIHQIRQQKHKKQNYTRLIQQKSLIKSLLQKQINEKQQNLLYHKKQVQKRIQNKIKLKLKVKQKKNQVKNKFNLKFKEFQKQLQLLHKQFAKTSNLICLQQQKINRLKEQSHFIQYNVQQVINHQRYMMNNQFNQFNNQQYMISSNAQQLNYANIPGFYSQPGSGRSNNQVNISKNSRQSNQQRNPNTDGYVLDILHNYFSNMSKHSQPESNQSGNSHQMRKFSFGQSPSFNTHINNQHQHRNLNIPQNHNVHNHNQPNQNPNFLFNGILQQALNQKFNNQQLHQYQQHHNPQNTSPQRKVRFHQNIFTNTDLQNISPIAKKNNQSINQQLRIKLQNINGYLKTPDQKRQLQHMIEFLSNHQYQTDQFCLQNYNESEIRINADNQSQSPSKKSPRLSFKKVSSQSPGHQRNLSDQNSRKSIKLPMNIQQSVVNIAYQSSQYSQNFNKQDFSPRKQESNQKRMRSPTHQVMPQIHEQMYDLRKTSNNLKLSDGMLRQSKNSGVQTPIFRSQQSDSQTKIGFSQPFMGQQFKKSQPMMEDQQQRFIEQPGSKIHDQQNQSNFNVKQTESIEYQKPNYSRNYSSELINIRQSISMSKQQPYPINKTQAFNTIQSQHQQTIKQQTQQSKQQQQISDDDFYSCTLGTQSKVFINSYSKTPQQNNHRTINIQDKIKDLQCDKNQKNDKIKSSRNRYELQKQANLVLYDLKKKNVQKSLNLTDNVHNKSNPTHSHNQQQSSSYQFEYKKNHSVQLQSKGYNQKREQDFNQVNNLQNKNTFNKQIKINTQNSKSTL